MKSLIAKISLSLLVLSLTTKAQIAHSYLCENPERVISIKFDNSINAFWNRAEVLIYDKQNLPAKLFVMKGKLGVTQGTTKNVYLTGVNNKTGVQIEVVIYANDKQSYASSNIKYPIQTNGTQYFLKSENTYLCTPK